MSSHRIEQDAQSHMALSFSLCLSCGALDGRPMCMSVEWKNKRAKPQRQSVQMAKRLDEGKRKEREVEFLHQEQILPLINYA